MFGWKKSGANVYPTYVTQTVNLRTPGLRTILQSGTVAAPFAGDALVNVPFWLTGGHLVWFPTISSETPDVLARFAMVGQADQGVGAETLAVNTATSGLDVISGTVVGSLL
jgi:hypothetical protein